MTQVVKPKSPEPEATLMFPFLDKMPETNQLHLPNLNSQGKEKEMFIFVLHVLLGPSKVKYSLFKGRLLHLC